MLRLCEGIVRRALSEPSIGSITTRAVAAGSRSETSPRSSETATNEAPCAASASSSAKTTSSQRRSIARVWSPPSPTPS